jgi:tyrosyl-tRNA synthetase
LQVDVKSKIKKAFCPVKITEGNPCLEYIQHILFPWFGKFEVLRNERSGGNRSSEDDEKLEFVFLKEARTFFLC